MIKAFWASGILTSSPKVINLLAKSALVFNPLSEIAKTVTIPELYLVSKEYVGKEELLSML